MQTGTDREGKVVRVDPVSPRQVPSRLRWHRLSSAFIREAGAWIPSWKIKGDQQSLIDTKCFRKSCASLRQTHQGQKCRNGKECRMSDQTSPTPGCVQGLTQSKWHCYDTEVFQCVLLANSVLTPLVVVNVMRKYTFPAFPCSAICGDICDITNFLNIFNLDLMILALPCFAHGSSVLFTSQHKRSHACVVLL